MLVSLLLLRGNGDRLNGTTLLFSILGFVRLVFLFGRYVSISQPLGHRITWRDSRRRGCGHPVPLMGMAR